MALFDVVQARIPELGKIKIGGKSAQVRRTTSGQEWRAPEKYDHFVITTLHRDERGDLRRDEALMEVLRRDGHADKDGKLRQLPIAVLSNDIEEIVQASYVWYVGKRIAARSDGKTLVKFYDGKNWLNEPVEAAWDPANLQKKDGRGNRYFKVHATFNCVLAVKQGHWGGVYKFRTTSAITASQLVGSLVEIKQLTGGILRGLPLRLAVRPLQVSPEGKTTTVYVVHCEIVGDDLLAIQGMAMDRARMELRNAKQLEAARLEYRRLIHAPGECETIIEQAEIAEEFHPEEPEAPPDPPAGIDPLLQDVQQPAAPAPGQPDIIDAGSPADDDLAGDDIPGDDGNGFDAAPPVDEEAERIAMDLFDELGRRLGEAKSQQDWSNVNREIVDRRAALGDSRFEELHRKSNEAFQRITAGRTRQPARK